MNTRVIQVRSGMCTPALTKKICKLLANGNTIAASCESLGIGVSTYHEWRQGNADFMDATPGARAKARILFVKEIKRLSADDWRGWAWLAERMFPSEFARSERVEQVNEQADEKKSSVSIYYDTQGQGMEKLTAFPVHHSMVQGSDTPAEAEAKQKRLLGERTNAPEPAISDAELPPKPLNPALTGRIREMPTSRTGK